MKLTTTRLKRLIREEIQRVQEEQSGHSPELQKDISDLKKLFSGGRNEELKERFPSAFREAFKQVTALNTDTSTDTMDRLSKILGDPQLAKNIPHYILSHLYERYPDLDDRKMSGEVVAVASLVMDIIRRIYEDTEPSMMGKVGNFFGFE
tara:strand:- start:52 stop:501 length:450 start_codon:yes stop_codon:yes gene_type:complete